MRQAFRFKSMQRGMTLVELMVTLAIVGILMVLAAPSFQDQLENRRLNGAAEGLAAALQNAKAEAVKTNATKRIVFTAAGGVGADNAVWCYGMISAPTGAETCDCSGAAPPPCDAGSVVLSTGYTGISVNYNNAATRGFNPMRGTTNDSGTVTFKVTSDINKSLAVVTTTLGRIRVCLPGTSTFYSNDSGGC